MHLRDRLLGRTALYETADPPAGGAAPPPAQAELPKAEPPKAEPPAAPPAAAAPPAPPKPAAPPAPKKDWRDDRIAELTAKLNAAKAEKAGAPPQTPDESQEAFEARVAAAAEARATEMFQTQDWTSRCNAVADAGAQQFPDFGDRLKSLTSLVNGKDPEELKQYNQVLEAAMETGRAHEVLYDLSSDPGSFQKLMRATPVKRAMEVAKLAGKLEAAKAPPAPSDAPPPVKPIGSQGAHYEGIRPDDPAQGTKLPIAAWMELREKQARERRIQ